MMHFSVKNKNGETIVDKKIDILKPLVYAVSCVPAGVGARLMADKILEEAEKNFYK